MTSTDFGHGGFQPPAGRKRPLTRRHVAFAQLLMTAALVVSIAVAATAVSIGIARAGGALSCVSMQD